MHDRPFLAWMILTCLYATALWWGWYDGFLGKIWEADPTHITVLIGCVFVFAVGVTGKLSYDVERWSVETTTAGLSTKKGFAIRLDFARELAGICIFLGLLCTVYGLIAMLEQTFVGVNYAAEGFFQTIMPVLGKHIGLAFYGTATGISSFVAVWLHALAISQAIRRKWLARD